MSAHVLVKLNKFRKRDKMRGLPSILSLFRNELNKFNNTRARFIIRHKTYFEIVIWRENIRVLPYARRKKHHCVMVSLCSRVGGVESYLVGQIRRLFFLC